MANQKKIPINRSNKFFSQEDYRIIVYKTTNLVNGKIYVGQDSKNNSKYFGSGVIIKRAIKKYGKENFKKIILKVCIDKEEMDKVEKYWIGKLNSTNKSIGYNITLGGGGCLGQKHTEEYKEYMRVINSGKNNPMYGKKLSDKTLKERSVKVKLMGLYKGKNNGNFKYNISKKELKQLFLIDNKTIIEISKIFNCSVKVINNNLRNYNLNKPKSNKYNLDIIKINLMLEDGLSQVKIGEYYGCSNKIINKFIKKNNIYEK